MALFETTWATARLASERPGHGIIFEIKGAKPLDLAVSSAFLDAYGENLWKTMPAGTSTLASWLLPLPLRDFRPSDFSSGSRNIHTRFGLGLYKLSHSTVLTRLKAMQREGNDEVFVIDVLGNPGDAASGGDDSGNGRGSRRRRPDATAAVPLMRLATRPSLILRALENGGSESDNIIYTGDISQGLRSMMANRGSRNWLGTAWQWMRWWLLPGLFTCAAWTSLINMSAFDALPRGLLVSVPKAAKALVDVLPAVPKTLLQSFSLGELNVRLAAAEAAGNATAVTEVLQQAAGVVGRAVVSAADLRAVPGVLADLEAERGIVQRVTGFFSFVNCMWLAAILGITISIGPSIYHILKPLRELLTRIARWTLNKIIIPTVEKLHKWGVFEALAWGAATILVVDGIRLFRPETGFYISLSGVAAMAPAFAYSTFLHGHKAKNDVSSETFTQILNAWIAATCAPLAVQYGSSLFGFGTVIAIYSVLGFSTACYGLCYAIGFRSKNSLERVVATSSLLLLGYSALKYLDARAIITSQYFAPFTSPIAVMGSFTMFLGLLILSSRYYTQDLSQKPTYAVRNLLMISALVTALFFGNVYAISGMTNTALTFGALWVAEKYGELHIESRFNGWILVLIFSALTYKASLWLHLHPEFIASLFDGF